MATFKSIEFRLSIENNTEFIVDNSIYGEAKINSENYKAKWIVFRDCKFHNNLIIHDVNLGIGISFYKCEFNGDVILEDITASGFDNDYNSDSRSIVFEDCIFKKPVLIAGDDFSVERDLIFEGCKILSGIEIHRINITIQSIQLKKCVVDNKLDVFNCSIKQNLTISECEINCKTRFSELKLNTIAIINNNVFNKDLHIRQCRLEYAIILNDGQFNDEVYFYWNDAIQGLTIIGGEYYRAVWLTYPSPEKNNSALKKIYLSSCSFQNGIYVNRNNEHFFNDRPIVHNVTIDANPKLQGNVHFKDIDIGTIEIRNLNDKANLVFENIWVNKIYIENFINQAQLVFSNVRKSLSKWYQINNRETSSKRLLVVAYHEDENDIIKSEKQPNELISQEESKIHIRSSNLGKAQFYQMDFSSFDKVDITNSIIFEIATSKVKWFVDDKLGFIDLKSFEKSLKKNRKHRSTILQTHNTGIDQYLSHREIYRQLKIAMEKQGDKPQALEFQKLEMKYYKKVLKYDPDSNWQDKFILWLSQTNDHGQSWWKATWIASIAGFIMYIPIAILSATNLNFQKVARVEDIPYNLQVIFYDQIHLFPQLLNPAHILSRMADINNAPGAIHFFDFFMRITMAYFIFQIVSAFRKYVKQ